MDKDLKVEVLRGFFHKVFGLALDLSQVRFPDMPEGYVSMINPPELSCEKALEGLVRFAKDKYPKVIAGTWMPLHKENLMPVPFQERPAEQYVFSYLNTSAPDILNWSQDEAVSHKLAFMSAKEYILATGFHFFRTGSFWDLDGRTTTILSERWNYGGIDSGSVYGFFRDRAECRVVCLFIGNPQSGTPTSGIRRVFL